MLFVKRHVELRCSFKYDSIVHKYKRAKKAKPKEEAESEKEAKLKEKAKRKENAKFKEKAVPKEAGEPKDPVLFSFNGMCCIKVIHCLYHGWVCKDNLMLY